MRKLRFDPRKLKVILDSEAWGKTQQEFLKNRPTNILAVPQLVHQITQISLSLLYNTLGYQQVPVCSSFMFEDKDKPSNLKHLTGTPIPAVLADWLTWRYNPKETIQKYRINNEFNDQEKSSTINTVRLEDFRNYPISIYHGIFLPLFTFELVWNSRTFKMTETKNDKWVSSSYIMHLNGYPRGNS